MRAINLTTGGDLAPRLLVAETLFSRCRGLLGRDALPPGEGLLIRPCLAVHTFLMKFPIDVLFLDRANLVIAALHQLGPYRFSRIVLASAAVIELPAGTVQRTGTAPGHRIEIA